MRNPAGIPPRDDGRLCLIEDEHHNEIWVSGLSGPVTVYDRKGYVLADSVIIEQGYMGRIVRKNGKVGYIAANESDHASFLPPVYDSIICKPIKHIENFFYGFALVEKNGKWGIAQHGREMTPLEFDSIHGLEGTESKTYFITYRNGKQGLMDDRGYVFWKPECDSVFCDPELVWENPFVVMKRNGKYDVRNAFHHRFRAKEYYDAVDLKNYPLPGKLVVHRNGGWGALNEKCRERIAPGNLRLETL